MQLILANEVWKCFSLKLPPLESNIWRFLTSDNLFTYSLNCMVSSIFVPYLTVLKAGMQFMKEMRSSSIYSKLDFLWRLHCNLNLNRKGHNKNFLCRSDCCAAILWILVHQYTIWDIVDPICDFVHIKAFFLAFRFCDFQGFYLWKRKTTPLMFEVLHHSSLTQKSKMVCPAT